MNTTKNNQPLDVKISELSNKEGYRIRNAQEDLGTVIPETTRDKGREYLADLAETNPYARMYEQGEDWETMCERIKEDQGSIRKGVFSKSKREKMKDVDELAKQVISCYPSANEISNDVRRYGSIALTGILATGALAIGEPLSSEMANYGGAFASGTISMIMGDWAAKRCIHIKNHRYNAIEMGKKMDSFFTRTPEDTRKTLESFISDL